MSEYTRKTFLESLKCSDEVAVVVDNQPTMWRKATIKHGANHGSFVVEMTGREITFDLEGVCKGEPERGVMDKRIVPLTNDMLNEAKRVKLLGKLSAYDFNKFTNAELEAIILTLDNAVRSKDGENKAG